MRAEKQTTQKAQYMEVCGGFVAVCGDDPQTLLSCSCKNLFWDPLAFAITARTGFPEVGTSKVS